MGRKNEGHATTAEAGGIPVEDAGGENDHVSALHGDADPTIVLGTHVENCARKGGSWEPGKRRQTRRDSHPDPSRQ